ncbi:hypothetical protein EIP91_005825 [Steccherinum ochraceum]|uniref:GED domain-containing protein n=1 Tax=Steccherinum ochraceum TaxID=92696 RepID=A0A4R0R9F6_9APHY|nr:hypothetical protein EIP91_005825 [Steccherinum ochraceum]
MRQTNSGQSRATPVTPTFGQPTAPSTTTAPPPFSFSGGVFGNGAPTSKRPLHEPSEHEKLVAEAMSALTKLGYTHITPEDLGKLVPPDVYEQEMDVMAEVRAYFQVAYKRVIDNIPMAIDQSFLFAFAYALQPYLIKKLGLGTATSSQRCALYLAEDPNVVAEREELTARKKRLESVQTELYNFGL